MQFRERVLEYRFPLPHLPGALNEEVCLCICDGDGEFEPRSRTHAARTGSTIQIKDPAEFNAYQMATTQSDPKAKAAALEGFLTKYPQSVVKKAVLDMLLDTYQQWAMRRRP